MQLSQDLLIDLTKTYGTPLYVYDGDLILKRYQELQSFIQWRPLTIHYAMKANFCPAILKLLLDAGASIDAVSPGDVLLAKKIGYSPDRILYTVNNITDDEMHRIKKEGVLFNIGSLSRLRKFAVAFPGSEVCLRLNPDVVAGAHAKIRTAGGLAKFGILLDDIEEVLRIVAANDLTVIGLHKHTGSGIDDTDKFLQAMQNVLRVATPENFPALRFLDFGGGFGIPYKPDQARIDYQAFGETITDVFAGFCKSYGRELELRFEPGRYLVAEAGNMLVEVNTLKNNQGRLIAGTNSGFPQLIRPMFYEAYHHIVNLSHPEGSPQLYDVCGNICETGDCFAVQRELPEVREGDILNIQTAGAYCYAMGGVYNLRAMPAEVLVLNGEATLVRRRLSDEDLVEQILGECA